MEIIIDEPNAKVMLFADKKYIEIKLFGNIAISDYQFVYEHALQFADNRKVNKFLVNELEAEIDGKSKIWLFSIFIPKMLTRLGLKLEVAIARKNKKTLSLNSKLLDTLLKKLREKFNLNVVEEEEEARKLLSEPRDKK